MRRRTADYGKTQLLLCIWLHLARVPTQAHGAAESGLTCREKGLRRRYLALFYSCWKDWLG
eukprot:6207968-Pleurochrysis_carterae.AAC.1